MPSWTGDTLKAALAAEAAGQGFVAFGVCSADATPLAGQRLRDWLTDGRHGGMVWMADTAERRASPRALWADVRSVVVLGLPYTPPLDPLRHAAHPDLGVVSVYALGGDYHEVVKRKLKALARWLVAQVPAEVKVFVDTAPVMEKPLAEASGLGWQGKHTNLVSTAHGSWLFLGVIYTTLELPSDAAHPDRCGSCTRCQVACPTDAFPRPYQLDARRCVSYLTIEHQGPIPRALRPGIGNMIYGCDICLAVCPWNRFAHAAADIAFTPRAALASPKLAELIALDDTRFRALFAGSPVKRLGWERLVRNALIAGGNSGCIALVPPVCARLTDGSAVVRGAAVWALHRLDPHAARALRPGALAIETDSGVRAEWLEEQFVDDDERDRDADQPHESTLHDAPPFVADAQ